MANALLRWLGFRAEALLETHWEDVKAVTVALLLEKTLNSSRLWEEDRAFAVRWCASICSTRDSWPRRVLLRPAAVRPPDDAVQTTRR